MTPEKLEFDWKCDGLKNEKGQLIAENISKEDAHEIARRYYGFANKQKEIDYLTELLHLMDDKGFHAREKRLRLAAAKLRQKPCETCGGSGEISQSPKLCPACKGTGIEK